MEKQRYGQADKMRSPSPSRKPGICAIDLPVEFTLNCPNHALMVPQPIDPAAQVRRCPGGRYKAGGWFLKKKKTMDPWCNTQCNVPGSDRVCPQTHCQCAWLPDVTHSAWFLWTTTHFPRELLGNVRAHANFTHLRLREQSTQHKTVPFYISTEACICIKGINTINVEFA